MAQFDIEELVCLGAGDFAVGFKVIENGLLVGIEGFLRDVEIGDDDSEGAGDGVEGGLDRDVFVGAHNSSDADAVGFDELEAVENGG